MRVVQVPVFAGGIQKSGVLLGQFMTVKSHKPPLKEL